MAVAPGTRLGPYEITSPLGAGGMGEVYRARDTRLDRSVAVKILPVEFAKNAQLKLRFEREAKTISALNHPHICTLYDVGREDGTDFIVMELVEGESLAERIGRAGALPVEEVLRYGIQIADALDRAHQQGVVHRDLKPANVMLTKSGAKLLDFGLAKSAIIALSPDGETVQKSLTTEGTIVGTFQYMAPEQLESQDVDHRADLFAFGAVLYEMATGRKAFDGRTKTSLIAAIVSSQPPPVSQLQPLAPPALEHVIQRCLAKDPADRWQSARDIAETLKWINEKGSQAGIAVPVAARRRARERWSLLLYPLIALAAAGLTWGVMKWRAPRPQMIVSSILPPPKAKLASEFGALALSPDGTRVAFIAQSDGGSPAIWIRPLSGGAAQALSGTEDATHPFWSPDGRHVGFFANGKLKTIDANGGPAQTLCDALNGRGAAWSAEGVIVFNAETTAPLSIVAETGGVARQLTKLREEQSEISHRLPFFLPDGRHFLYLAQRGSAGGVLHRLWVASLDGKLDRPLAEASSNAIYAGGYLVYQRENVLVAQSFDPKTMKLGRELTPLAESVRRPGRMHGIFSVAGNLLMYESGSSRATSQLAWVDPKDGKLDPLGKTGELLQPSISPDGRRIAMGVLDPAVQRNDIWIFDVQRRSSTRLTFDRASEFMPLWSPKGDRIVYSSSRSSGGDIMMRQSSGIGDEQPILVNRHFTVATDWSADGNLILYQELDPATKTDWDIWVHDLAARKSRVVIRTPFPDQAAKFSPDAKWVAYTSTDSGKQQVYVQSLSGAGGKWQVSTEGGTNAFWSRDGKQLFYLNRTLLMTVDVTIAGDEFHAGVPRQLLNVNFRPGAGWPYAAHPDGKRLVVNVVAEEARVEPVTMVQNWTEMLRK